MNANTGESSGFKNCSGAKALFLIVLFVEHYKMYMYSPKEQINTTMLHVQIHLKKREIGWSRAFLSFQSKQAVTYLHV